MGPYDEDELCRSEFGVWADELSGEERAGLIGAYVRRKRWEARMQAMSALETRAAVFNRPHGDMRGPDLTRDGERIERVSTKNGLAAMLHGKRKGR
jgi:hypothetical protein